MPDLKPGATFAGHRIEGIAGRGGMGIVYRATHLALDHVVALKVISADLAADDAFRRALPVGVADRRLAPPSERRPDPPRRRGGRAAVRDHGPDRRPRPAPAADRLGDARRPTAPSAIVAPGRLGARRRPLARPRPPRHQARQHPRRDATASDHAYLTDFGLAKRFDQATEAGALTRDRRLRRHARLRRARADPRRPRRRPHRRLRARLRAVRGDLRPGAVRRPRGERREDLRPPPGRAAVAPRRDAASTASSTR